jgi:hypothetical protein
VDPVFVWIARLGLSLLFASAAWHKARDLEAFQDSVVAYQVAPEMLARAAAPLFLGLEIVLAAALLWGDAVAAPGIAASLLALYTAAITWNLMRGRRDIDCGCLGPGRRQPLSEALVARNLLLIGAALLAAAPISTRPTSWIDAITVLGALVTLTLLYDTTARLGGSKTQVRALTRTGRST